MKFIITKDITLTILLLSGLTSYSLADSNSILPTSSQLDKGGEENNLSIDGIEIVEEIIITPQEQGNSKRNPTLKEGKACDDRLEPAELGPDEYQDIPMAKTIPCDKVDCSELKPAKLLKDSYKKIPMAKTTKIHPCSKKK